MIIFLLRSLYQMRFWSQSCPGAHSSIKTSIPKNVLKWSFSCQDPYTKCIFGDNSVQEYILASKSAFRKMFWNGYFPVKILIPNAFLESILPRSTFQRPNQYSEGCPGMVISLLRSLYQMRFWRQSCPGAHSSVKTTIPRDVLETLKDVLEWSFSC